MDFKHLRSFVAIVDYQNFSKAADKLNIAQSSVSTHLSQLEKELGAKLLYRTTKTIEVTDTGWKVYKYASQILELEDHVHETCTGNARRVLRIAASSIPATYILPGVLQQYRALYPNDYMKVSQCESKDIIEGVLDNRFDAGLIGQTVKRDGLRCVPICANPMIIITAASERYLNMQQRGASIKELLKEPVIMREEGQENCADRILNRMDIDRDNLKIAATVSDQETVKHMVASGMGVSVLSEIAAQDFIKEHRLLKFDLSKYQEENHIYLIYPETCTSKDHAWKFIDYLKESNALPYRH